MKQYYTIRKADGSIFSKHETKESALNYLYLLEGTSAKMVSPTGFILYDAKHLPKREKKKTKKGLFARLFRR